MIADRIITAQQAKTAADLVIKEADPAELLKLIAIKITERSMGGHYDYTHRFHKGALGSLGFDESVKQAAWKALIGYGYSVENEQTATGESVARISWG